MVPTFAGRVQTRIFLLLVIGVPVTLLITPLLAHPSGASLSQRYTGTFAALAVVLLAGAVFWEPIYHGLMQLRWEKDWPISFSLLQALPEGVATYVVLSVWNPLGVSPTWPSFAVHFLSVWIAVWLVAIGPMRVPFVRWRFRGGRVL